MEGEKWGRVKKKAEELVKSSMKDNDASHDAAHVFRVRDLALSLAHQQGLSNSTYSIQIVELAALLHDIGDYKYVREPSEEKIVEEFLEAERVEESMKEKILGIIKGMAMCLIPDERKPFGMNFGFKEEVAGNADSKNSLEFGVVQDADRLDAIGAIGIARCFTFGGSRKSVLHDPNIKPRIDMSKEQYKQKDKQTTINHFHEKLLKLKDLMKTPAGRQRAEKRHKFMEDFLKEFYDEWSGSA